MAYQYWSCEVLHKLCMDAFQKFGFNEKEADIIQDVLLTSGLFGIESHGMQRMVRYHQGIKKGMIKVDAKPEVVCKEGLMGCRFCRGRKKDRRRQNLSITNT